MTVISVSVMLSQESFIQMVKSGYAKSIIKLGRTRVKDYINKVFEDLTPLQWAIRNGHPETMEALIKLGAEASIHDLIWAVDTGNALPIELLHDLIKSAKKLEIKREDLKYTDLTLFSYELDSLSILALAVIKNNSEIVSNSFGK